MRFLYFFFGAIILALGLGWCWNFSFTDNRQHHRIVMIPVSYAAILTGSLLVWKGFRSRPSEDDGQQARAFPLFDEREPDETGHDRRQ